MLAPGHRVAKGGGTFRRTVTGRSLGDYWMKRRSRLLLYRYAACNEVRLTEHNFVSLILSQAGNTGRQLPRGPAAVQRATPVLGLGAKERRQCGGAGKAMPADEQSASRRGRAGPEEPKSGWLPGWRRNQQQGGTTKMASVAGCRRPHVGNLGHESPVDPLPSSSLPCALAGSFQRRLTQDRLEHFHLPPQSRRSEALILSAATRHTSPLRRE
jgi:hypothetical protein